MTASPVTFPVSNPNTYWHQFPSRFPKGSLLLLVSVLAAAATLPAANANDVFANVNSSLSVLANFKANGQIFTKPYPYIVIEDALDAELYSQLADNFLTNLDILRLNGENCPPPDWRSLSSQFTVAYMRGDLIRSCESH
jgi:hypothetical protein